MVKSMTGFGKMQRAFENRNITVELKSVNSRYCDINVKLNRKYSFLEEHIKKLIGSIIRRGKIETFINIENVAGNDVKVDINKDIIKDYMNQISILAGEIDVENKVSMEFLLDLPEVIKLSAKEENEEELLSQVKELLIEALDKFDSMRVVEGEKLAADIFARLDLIENNLANIEKQADLVGDLYRDKLKNRIEDIIKGAGEISEERIATEAAFFAEKANITEEIVRLKSHIVQMRDILNGPNSEGRKLDFLLQEMNREANTIGSKANDLSITKYMLDTKSEIEKIREQVQNIE